MSTTTTSTPAGSECCETPGDIPVRNVAHSVIGRPYQVYQIEAGSARRGAA